MLRSGRYNGSGEDSSNYFTPPQPSFALRTRDRPPPINTGNAETGRVPLRQENKLRKRESKGTLRGIFTRTKVQNSLISPVVEEEPPSTAISGRSIFWGSERRFPLTHIDSRTNTPTSATPVTPVTPAKSTNLSSRMNLRSKSVKHANPASKPKTSPKNSVKSGPRYVCFFSHCSIASGNSKDCYLMLKSTSCRKWFIIY